MEKNEIIDVEFIEQIKPNPFKRLFVGLLLWVVSIIIKYLVFGISLVLNPIYYVITAKWKTGFGLLGDWFFKMALSNDQGGNVQNAVAFRLIFTKKGGHPFGDEDDTISYVLARNKYKQKLTIFGRAMGWLLDTIEKSHLNKSIASKVKRDNEALARIHENKYFE